MQLNCDVNFKGSWCMFDGDLSGSETPQEKYAVLGHSDSTYSFVESDKKKIDALRTFSQKLFTQHNLFDQSVSLKDAEERRTDFDAVAKILNIQDNEDHYNLQICDSSKSYLFFS